MWSPGPAADAGRYWLMAAMLGEDGVVSVVAGRSVSDLAASPPADFKVTSHVPSHAAVEQGADFSGGIQRCRIKVHEVTLSHHAVKADLVALRTG